MVTCFVCKLISEQEEIHYFLEKKVPLKTTVKFGSEIVFCSAIIRDGVYFMLSITITLPSITITFQIFKSITVTITLPSITSY